MRKSKSFIIIIALLLIFSAALTSYFIFDTFKLAAHIECSNKLTFECISDFVDNQPPEKVPNHLLNFETFHTQDHIVQLVQEYKEHIVLRPEEKINLQKIDSNIQDQENRLHFFHLIFIEMVRFNQSNDGYYVFSHHSPETVSDFLRKITLDTVQKTTAWYSFLENWTNEAQSSEEPLKSSYLLKISKIYYETGDREKARELLKLISNLNEIEYNKYVYLFRNLKPDLSSTELDIDSLQPLTRAKILILDNQIEPAKKLLEKERNKALQDYSHRNDKSFEKKITSPIQYLEKIALLYEEMGEKISALEILNEAVNLRKTDPIKKSFTNNSDISELYRKIGHPEISLEYMKPYIEETSSKSCSSFNTVFQHNKCAVELIYLSEHELAYSKIKKHCKKRDDCPVAMIYIAAMEKGVEPPAISLLLDAITDDLDVSLYTKLASYHYSNFEYGKGDLFLEEAINHIPDQKKKIYNYTCDLAYFANARGRHDLLKALFVNSINLIQKRINSLEKRVTFYRDVIGCFENIPLEE